MCTIFGDFTHIEMNEETIVQIIMECTEKWNKDNISRTLAYFRFYQVHPEIKWAFLASMVSRNAGWNMCDLEGTLLKETLPPSLKRTLFLIYEKANYLIFKDVFPQLLLYHYSTSFKSNLFHYHKYFSVSSFMKREWGNFWDEKDEDRLMTALIINEQNVIQEPVIEDHFLRKKVFNSFLFYLQDQFHFSFVIFPTVNGDLYGASVHHFKSVSSRIQLGKSLASLLFSKHYSDFYHFAAKTEHTGSREDYEKYVSTLKKRETPYLRKVYPVIKHPQRDAPSWDRSRTVKKSWLKPVKNSVNNEITKWYNRKQKQLRLLINIHTYFFGNSH